MSEYEHKHEHGFGQYGPGGPDGPSNENDRTGNGTVNNGHDGPDNGTPDLGGPAVDELALRRLLHGAVQDLQPADGTLDHLRRAVPARRARKRQALVGVAAAALLFGTAVPAAVHVASAGSTSDDRPVNAGHGEQVQGGTGEETGDAAGGPGAPSTGSGRGPGAGETGEDAPPEPGSPATGTSDGTVGGTEAPASTAPDTVPRCEAAQLGVASAEAGQPDADGKVYGTFRIANVSGTDCAVTGAGGVAVQAAGSADQAKVSVVAHTAGDAAAGLPDPSQEAPAPLLLKPSGSYEVRFAWVPSETCPVEGGGSGGTSGGEPTPDPSPTDGASTETAGADGAGTAATEPQLVREDDGDGTRAEGSVTVSHTAEPGGPSAEATIPNACAGTVYRTGLLPTQ
ncbi:hypothetical protein ACF068_19370 [Streptomyces sp. NPDC016309]|uniref:hypothetical protein n=1 Tax=Streptomyces sp. NPDC016309 TaxID=3364965 RepID=UPI0036FC66F3